MFQSQWNRRNDSKIFQKDHIKEGSLRASDIHITLIEGTCRQGEVQVSSIRQILHYVATVGVSSWKTVQDVQNLIRTERKENGSKLHAQPPLSWILPQHWQNHLWQ